MADLIYPTTDEIMDMNKKIESLFREYFVGDVYIRSTSFVNIGRLVATVYSLDIKEIEHSKKQILILLDEIKDELKEKLGLTFYKIIPYFYDNEIDIWLCKHTSYIISNIGKIKGGDYISPNFYLNGEDVLLKKYYSK